MEHIKDLDNTGRKFKDVASQAEKYIKEGGEHLKELAHKADKNLHENPWPVVAGVAVVSLLIGFVMGTTRRGN